MTLVDILNLIGIDPTNTPEGAELTVSWAEAEIDQFVTGEDGKLVKRRDGSDLLTERVTFPLPA